MSNANDKRLFWACFISLVTTAFGFIIRAFLMDEWANEFHLTETQKGEIFGVGLWPFAISIVLFSLVIDRIGYGRAMIFAFGCHILSAAITIAATLYTIPEDASADLIKQYSQWGYWLLYIGNLIVALGNGTVEAVINPVVATMFSKEKTKWLNILHAGWPGGLVLGGIIVISMGTLDWEYKVALILLPTVVYGGLMLTCAWPVSERVEAGVSHKATLQEAGFLGALVVLAMICLQAITLMGWNPVATYSTLIIGGLLLLAFTIYTQSLGRVMFFVLLLLMIPLATTELGTDSWITDLMKPEMKEFGLASGWVLVYTSAIMMVLRFFAGPIVHRISPLGLLAASSAIAAVGLMGLSWSTGVVILIAATVYGVGKTFFWPTMLGVVSEQFPKGGALTLNAIGGVGMLAVGVLGSPILGYLQDTEINDRLKEQHPQVYEKVVSKEQISLLGRYQALDQEEVAALSPDQKEEIQKIQENVKKATLMKVAILPTIMLVGYLLLILYFRAKGGYEAEELTKHGATDEILVGGDPAPTIQPPKDAVKADQQGVKPPDQP